MIWQKEVQKRNNNKSNNTFKEKNDNRNNSSKNINSFIRLPILYLGIIFSLVGLLTYETIQIVALYFSRTDTESKSSQNNFSTEILLKIPKLSELLFYSVRSVFANDLNQITTTPQDFDKLLRSNHYHINIDISKDSLFHFLDESYFAAIYYQYMITKVNLLMFSQDAYKYDAFPKTIAMEDKINKKNEKLVFIILHSITLTD